MRKQTAICLLISFISVVERKTHAMPCMPKKCMVDNPFCSIPARHMRELTVTNSNKKIYHKVL